MPGAYGLWQSAVASGPAKALALPEAVAQWSLSSLREKLIKIGAKVVHHARYAVFQMVKVAIPRELFEKILRLIEGLRTRPAPASD
jgi:Transposase DDE domain group 1